MRTAHAQRVDFTGCVISPAFVDAHVHLTPTGIGLLGLDLSGVRSGTELLQAVRTYAEQHTGRVIWGHGYDPHDFRDDLPTPDQLAEAGGGCPVTLTRADGHSSLVDRHTLQSAPLARSEGVDRDSDGQPTGVLRREANKIVRRWAVGAMSEQELDKARTPSRGTCRQHGDRLGARNGWTRLHGRGRLRHLAAGHLAHRGRALLGRAGPALRRRT
jgi:predicted amidohydrolase YtcJ